MKISFNPSTYLLGIFTGGWWAIGIALLLVVGIALLMRSRGKSALFITTVVLVALAAITGTGFILADILWLVVVFWVTLGLAVIGMLLNAFHWLPRLGWLLATRVVAVVALVSALLLSSGLTSVIGSWWSSVGFADPNASLVVTPGDLIPAAAKCTAGDTYSPGDGQKLWADSLGVPLKAPASDPAAMLAEDMANACVNPTIGDANAQALKEGVVTGNWSIGGHNPWIATMVTKGDKDGLRAAWLTHKLDDKGGVIKDNAGNAVVYVTAEYQRYAEMTNTLLLALRNQGVKTGVNSVVNWPASPLVVGELPRAYRVDDPNAQEKNKPALALVFTTKAGEACPYTLWIDTLDERPFYSACTPTTPPRTTTPPKVTTPPTTTPPHTTPPTTSTPTPSCPPGQGTPPACLTPKDASVIPTNAYHTPAASPPGPAETTPVKPTATANPTVTPGSGSTQQAPGATKAPTTMAPVPPPEVSNAPTNPATGCVDPDTGLPC